MEAETYYSFIDDEVVDKTILWEKLCRSLEDQIGAARMTSTFSRVIPLGVTDEGEFVLGVPNAFNHSVITTMHLADMSRLASELSGFELTCDVVLDPALAPPPEDDPVVDTTADVTPHIRVEESANEDVVYEHGFTPKFTFDSFIVGQSNELAYSVSLAVAENPGLIYNPLFIWGGPGLGKTHLLQAIGSYVAECYPNKKIVYTTSEELTNKYVEALRVRKVDPTNINWLRNEYRTCDLLIIDDIQFLVGKESSTEFFFHTFNSLQQQRKQIVIASDRSPDNLDFEDRYTSRFKSGVLADIQPPSYEMRLAILQQYIKTLKIEFAPDAIAYIAEKTSGNIREMEGVVNSVVAYAGLRKIKSLDLEFVKNNTAGLLSDPSKRPVSVDTIIKEACRYYNVQRDDLISKSRKTDITHARHVAMYLCHELTDSSYPAIGRAFGKRDHSTVMHADGKIQRKMGEDRDLFTQIQSLTDQIKKRAI